jgi:hypothetical protein
VSLVEKLNLGFAPDEDLCLQRFRKLRKLCFCFGEKLIEHSHIVRRQLSASLDLNQVSRGASLRLNDRKADRSLCGPQRPMPNGTQSSRGGSKVHTGNCDGDEKITIVPGAGTDWKVLQKIHCRPSGNHCSISSISDRQPVLPDRHANRHDQRQHRPGELCPSGQVARRHNKDRNPDLHLAVGDTIPGRGHHT